MRFAFIIPLVFFACEYHKPAGIMPVERKGGPVVKYDVEAKPVPEIPMPNNAATRIDKTSPTGLRLNVSMIAPTNLEEDMRKKINNLTGFGVYSPIWVSFTEPLDVENLMALQGDGDYGNDAVYLVNISEESNEFGRVMPLDIGNGNFPVLLERIGDSNLYFENDPRRDASNILFETYDEDKNMNGAMDAGEDSDMDGILDSPNVLAAGENPVDALLSFYERETNTLIIRPVLPLMEETTYAVVLLKNLKGADGNPVESPFPYVNHSDQTDELGRLSLVSGLPFKNEDIAFAWVFTTAGFMRDLLVIRAGLYGHGPMAYLSENYPVDAINMDFASDPDGDNPYILKVDPIVALFEALPDIIGGSEQQRKMFIDDLKAIDYFILGSFKSPYFLADRDGVATARYPADDDEIFDVDPITGKAVVGEDYVTFICAVPKPGKAGSPPFPVGFVGHGYTGNRLDAFLNSGRFARFGIAACGLDATGHGLPDIGEIDPEIEEAAKLIGLTSFIESIQNGRARDLNNNGEIDSGGDYWTADIFHTRDVVRQTLVDYMQFIRILRSFDGKRKWSLEGKGLGDVAGDFNNDGVVDIGGDGEKYHATGGSLGGIISGALAGIEPALASAAPDCGRRREAFLRRSSCRF
ncbi:MAG: hypothetical protein FJ088_02530 [Deltaproteobacteria bacterium]|nr:hypothetical protein [Deltaproteobacteria bacterium]